MDEYIHSMCSGDSTDGCDGECDGDSPMEGESLSHPQPQSQRRTESQLQLTRLLTYINQHADSVRETAQKRVNLSRKPAILCIHVKRIVMNPFTGGLQKCNHWLDFPLELDCKEYSYEYQCVLRGGQTGRMGRGSSCDTGTVSDGGTVPNTSCNSNIDGYRYRLNSVVVHMGGVDAGHYVTYTRYNTSSTSGSTRLSSTNTTNHTNTINTSSSDPNPTPDTTTDTDDWVLLSDTTISRVSLSQVLKQQAYMLFYEQCN